MKVFQKNFLNSVYTENDKKEIILDIENPYEIYPKLQKIVLDIQADIEFPNAYRPSENPGYNTEYRG